MKPFLQCTVLVIALTLLAPFARAEFFGYSALITAQMSGTQQSQVIRTGSLEACEAAKRSAIALLESGGWEITNSGPCLPIIANLPKPKKYASDIPIKWPFPPVCLSCPLVIEDLRQLLFPEVHKQVEELVNEFQIESYLKDLGELQNAYDLSGFEEKMFELEQLQ